MMPRKYSTFSRTSMPIPQLDIRVKPNHNMPWSVFSQEHKDVLQIYYLVVNNVLSHSEGIDLDELSKTLRFSYMIPTPIVDDFTNFITWNETTEMEFEEKINGVRTRMVYARPIRQKPTIVGRFSRWLPH